MDAHAALDTRERIMAAARASVQARGYGGLSFRELAKAVGIKSASVHYHFATKADLGAAIAHHYALAARADLDAILAETRDPATCIARYAGLFRKALADGNRMCLCGILGAEYDQLHDMVKTEIATFAALNVDWLAKVLGGGAQAQARALALHAAISGAQLAARSRGDIAIFDAIVESYRVNGLIPPGA